MESTTTFRTRLRRRSQLLRSHPRLISSLAAGLAVTAFLPASWSIISRALIGWNAAIWSYLALMLWLVARSDADRAHRLAKQEDANALFVLVVMSMGAILSLAAIAVELSSAKSAAGGIRFFHSALTAATVFGSWLLVGVIYTFHYAHLFYTAPRERKPLRFPEELATPGYWDFLYFSFTIAVAAQTSDISVVTSAMRKAVLAQSVLSFLFNAAIIGMCINIAAGILGS